MRAHRFASLKVFMMLGLLILSFILFWVRLKDSIFLTYALTSGL